MRSRSKCDDATVSPSGRRRWLRALAHTSQLQVLWQAAAGHRALSRIGTSLAPCDRGPSGRMPSLGLVRRSVPRRRRARAPALAGAAARSSLVESPPVGGHAHCGPSSAAEGRPSGRCWRPTAGPASSVMTGRPAQAGRPSAGARQAWRRPPAGSTIRAIAARTQLGAAAVAPVIAGSLPDAPRWRTGAARQRCRGHGSAATRGASRPSRAAWVQTCFRRMRSACLHLRASFGRVAHRL